MIIFKGKEIETDNEGYLKENLIWNESIAKILAEIEGITLSPEIWEIVFFVRSFYLEFNTFPPIRIIIKTVMNKFDDEKRNSRYLYKIFPKGPIKQASKIAGLPKPVRCT